MVDRLILKGLPKGYYTEDSTIYVVEDKLQTALDIKPEKIVKGQSIAGVSGLAVENGIDTTDANATAEDIISPKTAYVNGEKITGTMVNVPEVEIAKSIAWGGDHVAYFRMTNGAHITNASSGYPEVSALGQIKTITPSANEQTLYADTGKLLHAVTVNAIPNTYKKIIDMNVNIGTFNFGSDSNLTYNIPSNIRWNSETAFIICLELENGMLNTYLYFDSVNNVNTITYNGYNYEFILDYGDGVFTFYFNDDQGGNNSNCTIYITKVIGAL